MAGQAAPSALSDDAKCLLGGWFGMGLTEVNFAMREGRPTKRTQAAIDELVAAGMVQREPYQDRGFRLKPLVDAKPYARWLNRNARKGDWPLTEDIPKARGR